MQTVEYAVIWNRIAWQNVGEQERSKSVFHPGDCLFVGMAADYLPRISSTECGYPFTFLGGLYHSCVENMENVTSACERWGCVEVNYTAAICAANIGKRMCNDTINVSNLLPPTKEEVHVFICVSLCVCLSVCLFVCLLD